MFALDLAKDSAVEKWLSYYTKDKDVHDSKINYLRDFMKYVRIKPDFKDATPSSLIGFQLKADKADQRTKYKILDILQEYINEKGGRARTQTTRYSIVKNFFKKNRATLPDDDFRPVPTVDEVGSNLNIEIIKRLISTSDFDMKAIYLTLFMALLEREKFKDFNLNCGSKLVKHLKTYGIDESFKFNIPGRKGSKFRSKYYTFIGRDALEAWQEYFNNSERGWPKEGEPILYGRDGKPLTKDAISARHLRLLRKLQLINSNKGGSDTRHGYGLHNFRVEAKTHLHNRAKPEGFDMDYAKFWMGHITDPNRYDRFYRDEEAAVKHYKIAEKHLNLVSGESMDTKTRQELEELKAQDKTIRKFVDDSLQEKTKEMNELKEDFQKRVQSIEEVLRKPDKYLEYGETVLQEEINELQNKLQSDYGLTTIEIEKIVKGIPSSDLDMAKLEKILGKRIKKFKKSNLQKILDTRLWYKKRLEIMKIKRQLPPDETTQFHIKELESKIEYLMKLVDTGQNKKTVQQSKKKK
ncbi:hypothetical protein ACFLQ6_07960 [Thermoproteota archaeon]